MDRNHPTADNECPGRPPKPITAVINDGQMMFLDCPACLHEHGGQNAQWSVSPQVQSFEMTCQPRVTGSAETTSADVRGDTLNTTLTAICSIPGAGPVITPRRANARLAPGGRDGPRERDTRVARARLAGEAARWQRILDLLDPDKRCGAWSPATFQGRPVVCTRAPHDAREEHANAETGWRWYDETSSRRP